MRKELRLGLLVAASFAIALLALILAGTPEHTPLQPPPAQTAGLDRPAVSGSARMKAQPQRALAKGFEPEADPTPDGARQTPGAEDEEFTGDEIARLIAADPEFGRAIEAMLDDPDPDVRRGAAELFNAFLEMSSGANEKKSSQPERNLN